MGIILVFLEHVLNGKLTVFPMYKKIKMAGGTLWDDRVPSYSENSHNCEELMCQCCLKFKSELQEMQTELKSATVVSNISKRRVGHCM